MATGGGKQVQKYEGRNYGAVWHWAGALHTYFEYDALNSLTAYKTKKKLAADGMTPQDGWRTAVRPTG